MRLPAARQAARRLRIAPQPGKAGCRASPSTTPAKAARAQHAGRGPQKSIAALALARSPRSRPPSSCARRARSESCRARAQHRAAPHARAGAAMVEELELQSDDEDVPEPSARAAKRQRVDKCAPSRFRSEGGPRAAAQRVPTAPRRAAQVPRRHRQARQGPQLHGARPRPAARRARAPRSWCTRGAPRPAPRPARDLTALPRARADLHRHHDQAGAQAQPGAGAERCARPSRAIVQTWRRAAAPRAVPERRPNPPPRAAPAGTGKSSLVCALCVGLGGKTTVRRRPWRRPAAAAALRPPSRLPDQARGAAAGPLLQLLPPAPAAGPPADGLSACPPLLSPQLLGRADNLKDFIRRGQKESWVAPPALALPLHPITPQARTRCRRRCARTCAPRRPPTLPACLPRSWVEITLSGGEGARDHVIRREMRLQRGEDGREACSSSWKINRAPPCWGWSWGAAGDGAAAGDGDAGVLGLLLGMLGLLGCCW
jgi:hypothetical protein